MLRLVPLLLTLTACSSPNPVVLHGSTMGTTWTVTLNGPRDDAAVARADRAVRAVLAEADAALSAWNARSELTALNEQATTDWLPISDALYTVLDAARVVSQNTDGAFDVTVAPLVALWGFGANAAVDGRPSDAQIREARVLVGTGRLELRAQPRAARKRAPGLRLDLDAIAPGYAVDRISGELAALGFRDHIVEIGGEVICHGRGPGGRLWRVAIERPQTGARSVQALVALDGLAISTSGDYRDFRVLDGQRISHTIDPRSGRPVTHALASVSVVHADPAYADAMATALMVLGPVEGEELARRLKLAVLFVTRGENGFDLKATPEFERLMVGPTTAAME